MWPFDPVSRLGVEGVFWLAGRSPTDLRVGGLAELRAPAVVAGLRLVCMPPVESIEETHPQ
jgi:hypothetical protein